MIAREILISGDTLASTTECNKDFSCLTPKGNGQCKVDYRISKDVYFVNCMDTSCGYVISYGDSHLCNCPTRKELYDRYNI